MISGTDALIYSRSNAADLIDTFWKKQNAAKARRKSGAGESASRALARDRQKSTNLSGDESAVTTTKKRGRTSKAADAEGDTRTTKKAKKPANGKAQSVVDAKDNDDISVGNMNQYIGMPDWEPLIQSVDTVCSTEEGLLEVFFTLSVFTFHLFPLSTYSLPVFLSGTRASV